MVRCTQTNWYFFLSWCCLVEIERPINLNTNHNWIMSFSRSYVSEIRVRNEILQWKGGNVCSWLILRHIHVCIDKRFDQLLSFFPLQQELLNRISSINQEHKMLQVRCGHFYTVSYCLNRFSNFGKMQIFLCHLGAKLHNVLFITESTWRLTVGIVQTSWGS